MKILLISVITATAIAISGCTSGIATEIAGPLAGAAIEHNNDIIFFQKLF